MRRFSGWYWHHSAAVAAMALTLALGAAPANGQAVCGDGVVGGGGEPCVGDCGEDGEVTVDEIITMTNIALGSASVDTCPAGDSSGDGEITVDEILQATNNALNGCPAGAAGDAEAEECDDGGICTGGSNAGTACTAESQCEGGGICIGGINVNTGCSTDDDCFESTCVRCKPFGGDGCAANCTEETDVEVTFVPGESIGVDIVPGTSGAKITGDILTIPLEFTGRQILTIGKERNGEIPVAVKSGNLQIPQIPISTLACACVRGVEFKTCGGTITEPDGFTQTPVCTEGLRRCEGGANVDVVCEEDADCPGSTCEDVCTNGLPCVPTHGPGNSGSGGIGCESFTPTSIEFLQDCNGDFGGEPFDPEVSLFGEGGPGSALVVNGLAIGTVVGACQGDTPDYGPDGDFCTDDDPEDSRGDSQTLAALTGDACAKALNVNDFPGADIPAGPGEFNCTTGAPFSCADLANGVTSGANLAGAFVACDQDTTGDITVTSNFVGE